MMHSPLALLDLHSFAASRTTFLPVATGAIAGIAFALLRGGRFALGRDAESVMAFAFVGTLPCICGTGHLLRSDSELQDRQKRDRRQFCRSCGCEIVATDPALLEKRLDSREIEAMTRSFRRAARRASRLELPASVTTIDSLNRYLESGEPKRFRVPGPDPVPAEHGQVR